MSDSDTHAEDEPLFVQPPLKANKGRGAVSNLQGRYELLTREAIDDGWSQGNVGECSGANAEADCPSNDGIENSSA